jgi:capsular polysaccharide biosynthesis protein
MYEPIRVLSIFIISLVSFIAGVLINGLALTDNYETKMEAYVNNHNNLEKQLETSRISEAECKAVLVHTVNEGVRLTELIVKNNKGKK